jgi:hypothetical protein
MPDTFPIDIDGRRFASAQALADDIAERGEQRILPDRGLDHPSAYYERWMRADDSGRTTAAVLAACELLIADYSASGDAFDHAVALTGSQGDAATTKRILQRVAAGDVPDSRWYGTGAEIGHRALVAVTHAVQTKLPAERARLAGMLEERGDWYRAASLLLSGTTPDPSVVDVVARWAASAPVPASDAGALGSTATFHAHLVVPLAQALAGASEEARAAYQAEVDEYMADQSAAVAAALAGRG